MKSLPGVLLKLDLAAPRGGSMKDFIDYILVRGRHAEKAEVKLANLELRNVPENAIVETFDLLALAAPGRVTTRALIFSTHRGVAYSPELWFLLFDRWLHHLGAFARYADDRRGLEPVDLRELAAVLAIHINTDQEHLQPGFSLVHPGSKRRIIINEGQEIVASQYAIQLAQKELALVPDARMPAYELINGRMVRRNPKQMDDFEISKRQMGMEVRTGLPCAERLLKELLRDPQDPDRIRTPASFGTKEQLHRFLLEAEAGWEPKRGGAILSLKGGKAAAKPFGKEWQLPAMCACYGAEIGALGMPWMEQKRRRKETQSLQARFTAEELKILDRPMEETRRELLDLARTARFDSVEVWACGPNGRRKSVGTFNRDRLCTEAAVAKLRGWEAKGYTLKGQFSVVDVSGVAGLSALPLRALTENNLQRCLRDGLIPTFAIECAPNLWDIVLGTACIGNITQHRNALRLLAYDLAATYDGDRSVVPSSPIALPGFVSFAGPKLHLAKLVSCRGKANDKAYELLKAVWRRHMEIEDEILRGWIPEAARRLRTVPKSHDFRAELYRAHIIEMDRVQHCWRSPTDIERAHSLVEVDQRLAGRLLLAGLGREEAAAIIASGVPLLRTQQRDREYWQAYAANRVRDGARSIEGVPENPRLTRWNQTEKARAVKITREIDEKARLAPSQTRRDPSAVNPAVPALDDQGLERPEKEKKKFDARLKTVTDDTSVKTSEALPSDPGFDTERDVKRLEKLAAKAGFFQYWYEVKKEEQFRGIYERLTTECSEIDAGVYATIWAQLSTSQTQQMLAWTKDAAAPEPEWLTEMRQDVLAPQFSR